MDPKSTKNRPKVNPKIEAAKHMFSDALFNDFTWFLASFSDQNQREFAPRVKYVEKRKTFQNTAWASKNQGFASPKWTKKKREIVSKSLRTKKTSKSCRICRLAERLGLVWGAENERFAHILRSFSKRSKNWFAVTLGLAANQAKAAGLGGFRLSPWSFKVLGLLDLLLVALILLVSFSKGRNWLESVPTWIWKRTKPNFCFPMRSRTWSLEISPNFHKNHAKIDKILYKILLIEIARRRFAILSIFMI